MGAEIPLLVRGPKSLMTFAAVCQGRRRRRLRVQVGAGRPVEAGALHTGCTAPRYPLSSTVVKAASRVSICACLWHLERAPADARWP